MKPESNRSPLSKAGLASVAAGLSLIVPVFAQSEWTGVEDNNWSNANNWDPAVVPGNTSEVVIGSGAVVNSTSTFNRAADTTLNGSLSISNNGHFNIGNGGNPTFTVGSTGSLTYAPTAAGSQYFIGTSSGISTFTQNGGSVNVTVNRGVQVSDGSGAGRTGTFNINGGTFNVTIAASGASGGDAIGEIYGGFLAGRAGGTTPDSFNVAGGTATISAPNSPTRKFTLTNGASVNVTSGSLSFNGFAQNRLGYDDGNIADTTGSVSNVTVSGGSLTFAMGGTNPFFSVGATTNYNGAIEVTGGNLSFSGAQVILGDISTGTFSQSAGTIDLNGQNLLLANTLGSIGLYSMSGGTLFAGAILAGAGDATFDFTGGHIWLDGDQTALPDSSWFTTPDLNLVARDFDGTTTHIYIVPEPSSLLMAFGVLGIFGARRRR